MSVQLFTLCFAGTNSVMAISLLLALLPMSKPAGAFATRVSPPPWPNAAAHALSAIPTAIAAVLMCRPFAPTGDPTIAQEAGTHINVQARFYANKAGNIR